LAEIEKLVKNWENFLVETVRDVARNTIELVKEEVLQIRVTLLSILASFNISKNNIKKLKH
jgi:hypothetical protein